MLPQAPSLHHSPYIVFQAGPAGYQAPGNFRGPPQPQPPMDPAGYAAYQQQYFGWLQHQAQLGNPQVHKGVSVGQNRIGVM